MRVAPLKRFSAIPVFESLHYLAGLFEHFHIYEILAGEIKYQSHFMKESNKLTFKPVSSMKVAALAK